MGKKWWYRCGLQTQVLLAILCLTQYVFAAPLKTEAARKGKSGAIAKKHKSQPATLTSVRSQTKTDKAGKQIQPEVRKKRSRTAAKAAPVFSSTKSRTSSVPTKTARRTVTAKNKRAAASQTKAKLAAPKPTVRRQSRRATASASKNADRKHRSQFRSTTGRRVLVLKESKDRKYVKTIVTIPDPASRFESPPPSAVTETARQQTISESPPQTSSPKSEPAIVSAPVLMPALPSTEQLSSTPSPPSSLIAPVVPHREPTDASETALAVLKRPETDEETKPERPHSWAGYAPGRAAFHVKLNGERLLHRLNSAFVLPGDEIFVEVVDPQRKNDYTFRATLEKERQLGPTRWYWNAPSSPGMYSVKVQRTRSNTAVTLNVFVMVPLERIEDGVLNGYRIGHYPTVALRQQAIYTPPRGLIEVTRENENTLVSPHFRLRQFLCKQESDYPKYLALDGRLLTALELLLEKANARGYHARTFTVMSGYRTPYYNRAIGNSTRYSRHLWGDAADIYIDENPSDGRMDDLNQDGAVDSHDAEAMYDLIESGYDSRFQNLLVGGLARYRETSSHGPFVHVDVRGVASRWGARSTMKGTTPSTVPVALRANDLPHLLQPSYWEEGRETEATP